MIIKSYEILNNPKNFIKYNLFLLYGENNGLKNDIVDKLKNLLNKEHNKIELLQIYENEIIENDKNFYNSIYSGSLFSTFKIIIVNNGSDKILKNINDITENSLENVIVIILAEVLEKKSKIRNLFEKDKKTICIPCYPDNEKDLNLIAISEFKKKNIVLSRESINLLIEKSNNDRKNLKNEIEKIISYSLDKKKLDLNEVRSIINFSGEYRSDSFINECLCGNILQYKKILSELYIGSFNQIFLLRILSNKIQRLLNLKEQQSDNSSLDTLINTSKPPIFWKEKLIVKKQLTIWNIEELKNIISEINDTEILCKKKPQISKIIFFSFFNKLCMKANSYS